MVDKYLAGKSSWRIKGNKMETILDTGIPVPPKELVSANMLHRITHPNTVGKQNIKKMQKFVELRPDMQILDVGCGIGRMAIILTQFLNKDGKYRGFDINKERIAWCQAEITSRYPNFRFAHSNVFNGLYNRRGKIKPEEFEFPYKDDKFDFVYLRSVFTHMLPNDVLHYLGEIKRVLKPGGAAWITYLLVDDANRSYLTDNNFATTDNIHHLPQDKKHGESQVIYEIDWVKSQYDAYGLVVEKLIRGNLLTKRDGDTDDEGNNTLHFGQDVIIGRKPE